MRLLSLSETSIQPRTDRLKFVVSGMAWRQRVTLRGLVEIHAVEKESCGFEVTFVAFGVTFFS